MLRNLAADSKEFPATMAICALWVAVFAVMVARDLSAGTIHGYTQFLFGTLGGGHRLGDMTVSELARGQVWRAVTSTFVHLNVLHIAMNLYGMYVLGCLVESWYGPWQLVAIYTAIGGLGNLLSAAIRRALGMDPMIHTMGGSTVVLGLVALCAVVGWRSRTRIGDYLKGQMVGVLVFTALLGVMWPMIDNWGHAGGATAGAVIGFAHRRLIRSAHQAVGRWAGVVGGLILVASGAAQALEDRRERLQQAAISAFASVDGATRAWLGLLEVREFYNQAARRSQLSRFVPRDLLEQSPAAPRDPRRDPLAFLIPSDEAFRHSLKIHLAILDALRDRFGGGATAEDFRRSRALLARVLRRPPTPQEWREFQARQEALMGRAAREQKVAQGRFEAAKARLGGGAGPRPGAAPQGVARGKSP